MGRGRGKAKVKSNYLAECRILSAASCSRSLWLAALVRLRRAAAHLSASADARAFDRAYIGIMHMLLFPLHRLQDARAPRRMVVEDGFLQIARLQLAIAGQFQHHGGEGVGLARGVEAEQVGLL